MTTTRVALDASSLRARHGIGRYLQALLPRMIAMDVDRLWTLYARDERVAEELPDRARITVKADGGSPELGRIVSLFTSQRRWARQAPPDLYWSPAHRLPVGLPHQTARVVTIHDLCWLEAPGSMRPATRWLDRLLMPRALRDADRVIAVSHATRDTIERAFPDVASRVVVVHEACSPLPAAGAPVIDGPYVLAVGTVEPRKNFERLIEAFGRLSGASKLVIAGAKGWGMPEPAALAARHGLADRLVYLGAVDDATLSTLYRHARFLAMPSIYEGFGLPILEALSHGTPVLHGDNSSMPEVAGDAGVAVDAGSVDAIASGLSRLLEDDALHAALASRARAQAARFSWDRAARETLAVFDAAVQARRARR